MCMRCDGYSWEEIDRRTDLLIRVHGFMTVHVEAPSPWTYTVGAFESWDQPELLVVDVEASMQKALVGLLAEDYARVGEMLPSTLKELDLELVLVDESHFQTGMVASWELRYSMAATTGDFLQIVPGPTWFCGAHVSAVRRLDEAAGSTPWPG